MPFVVREEVNRRLHAGEPASKILPWLHSREDVLRVLDDYFDEQPVNAQNLTEWRQGGYRDWLDRKERSHHIKELSQYALDVAANSGGDLMHSTASIAGGQLLEILESLDVEEQKTLLLKKPETYVELLDKLARLQKSGADARRAAQAEKAAELAERKLELELAKFRRQTAEKFLDWRENERAIQIADAADTDREAKIEQLVQAMWGEKPEGL